MIVMAAFRGFAPGGTGDRFPIYGVQETNNVDVPTQSFCLLSACTYGIVVYCYIAFSSKSDVAGNAELRPML